MIQWLFRKKKIQNPEVVISKWISDGRPLPPPHIYKQKTIDEYRLQYDIDILVETGTYLGDMVEAQKNNFSKIFSVELSERLHRKAKKRFRTDSHVNIIHGDSGTRLSEIVSTLRQPALFWLDGHYSAGITAKGNKNCPVLEELSAIFQSEFAHIILIDDARLFNGTDDYPRLEELTNLLESGGSRYIMNVKDDIIRIIPKMKM